MQLSTPISVGPAHGTPAPQTGVVPGTPDQVWTDTTGTTDTAVLSGAAGTITIGASPLGALGLQFLTTGYTIQTGTFTLGSGGIDASTLTSGTTTISSGIALGAGQSWNIGSGATVASSGIISGTNALTKSGAGTLTLSGLNTYSGGTTISSGTLQLTQTAGAAATGTFSLGGGTLQVKQAGNNFGYAPNIGLTADSTFSNIGAGQINYTGTLTGNTHALNVNTATARLYVNAAASGITQFNVTSGAMGFDLNVGNRGGALRWSFPRARLFILRMQRTRWPITSR